MAATGQAQQSCAYGQWGRAVLGVFDDLLGLRPGPISVVAPLAMAFKLTESAQDRSQRQRAAPRGVGHRARDHGP